MYCVPVTNFHLMEGPYGSKFMVRRVRPEDVNKVCQHVKDYFLREEPLSECLGYTELYGNEFCEMLTFFIQNFNMTFWMEDTETKEVAAVRAIFIETEKDDFWDSFPRTCDASKIFFEAGEIPHREAKLFQNYNVNRMADLFLSSVAPKYRKQGLSQEMYRRTIKFLQAEKIPLVKSCFTSPFSRKVAARMGFEECNRLYFKDIKDSNGNPAIDPDRIYNTVHFSSLMVKRIDLTDDST